MLGWGCTNNEAEYAAAIAGVQEANQWLGPKALRTDSQLVAYQVSGQYQVRSARIRPYHARLLTALTTDWTVQWVPREENEAADLQSRLAVWDALHKWPLRGILLDGPEAERRALEALATTGELSGAGYYQASGHAQSTLEQAFARNPSGSGA